MGEIIFDQAGNIMLDGLHVERQDYGQESRVKIVEGKAVFDGFFYREQLRVILPKAEVVEASVLTRVIEYEHPEDTPVRRMVELVRVLKEMGTEIEAKLAKQKEG